jgi:clan AA aspartic protease (TIGR02281 family)
LRCSSSPDQPTPRSRDCEAGKVLLGDAGKPSAPTSVVGTTVVHDANGWRIDHHLANGDTVSRSSQYQVTDVSDAKHTAWTGTRQPNMKMMGAIGRDASGRMVYGEHLYRDNVEVMHMVAVCKATEAKVQPVADDDMQPVADAAPAPVAPAAPVAQMQTAPVQTAKAAEDDTAPIVAPVTPAPIKVPAPVKVVAPAGAPEIKITLPPNVALDSTSEGDLAAIKDVIETNATERGVYNTPVITTQVKLDSDKKALTMLTNALNAGLRLRPSWKMSHDELIAYIYQQEMRRFCFAQNNRMPYEPSMPGLSSFRPCTPKDDWVPQAQSTAVQSVAEYEERINRGLEPDKAWPINGWSGGDVVNNMPDLKAALKTDERAVTDAKANLAAFDNKAAKAVALEKTIEANIDNAAAAKDVAAAAEEKKVAEINAKEREEQAEADAKAHAEEASKQAEADKARAAEEQKAAEETSKINEAAAAKRAEAAAVRQKAADARKAAADALAKAKEEEERAAAQEQAAKESEDAVKRPSSPPPAAAPQGADYISIRQHNGNIFTDISVGGVAVEATVDTGASSLTLPVNVEQDLVAKGEADEGGVTMGSMADGRPTVAGVAIVHSIKIGSHVLHNVKAMVMPEGAPVLLGLPVLNKIGRFTVDAAAGRLTFNS